MSSLWTCISGLNDSIVHHDGIMDLIQKNQDDVYSRMKNLNSSLNQVLNDLQTFSGHNVKGKLDFISFTVLFCVAQFHIDG